VTTAREAAIERLEALGLSRVEAVALLLPVMAETYREVADDAADGATAGPDGTTVWGATPAEALTEFAEAYRKVAAGCDLPGAPMPTTSPALDRERARHEEHRRSFAALFGLPAHADWAKVTAAATGALQGHDARRRALSAALGLRDDLSWTTLLGTTQQVDKAAAYHYQRAEAAETQVARVQDAVATCKEQGATGSGYHRAVTAALDGSTEAHPPLRRWRVEILDGEEWMPATASTRAAPGSTPSARRNRRRSPPRACSRTSAAFAAADHPAAACRAPRVLTAHPQAPPPKCWRPGRLMLWNGQCRRRPGRRQSVPADGRARARTGRGGSARPSTACGEWIWHTRPRSRAGPGRGRRTGRGRGWW